jgi:hypothetical protein
LFQRGSRTPPEHSSPDCGLRWSSLRRKGTQERSSSEVLEARWSKFLSRKSCSWRKSTGWRHFVKVIYENDLKIKKIPNPENFDFISIQRSYLQAFSIN